MIVSHKHKFIFIKTQKTASSSMEIFFTKHCGAEDIITPLVREQQKGQNYRGFNNIKSFLWEVNLYGAQKAYRNFVSRVKFFDHMPASLAKMRLPSRVWNDYFKFCFERNPWDKMVSYYYWSCRKRKCSFDDFLEEENYCINYNLYTNNDNQIIVDHIGKYEQLDEELEIICKIIGIEFNKPLAVNAKSGIRKKKSYRDFYTDDQRMKIGKIFANEIDSHGYQF